MPPPIPVVLAPYDPAWPAEAVRLGGELATLGSVLVTVHHIGSTAVPGLAAKPIIDLLPVVSALSALDRARERVEALGYEWHGEFGIPERRFCTLSRPDLTRLVNAHFFEQGSPEITRHVAFRDYLCAHPDIAGEYTREKRRARELHPEDSHAYTDAKSAWIRNAEKMALEWHAART